MATARAVSNIVIPSLLYVLKLGKNVFNVAWAGRSRVTNLL
jgi:hypothetical protein